MKNIKTLVLAVAVILFGLTSCSNNDSKETPIPGDDFRVSISFLSNTRADGAAAVANTKVVITDGYLLFANAAEMITDVYTIKTGAVGSKEIEASTLGATAVVLDKVSGTSTKVYMLANKGTLVGPKIGASATTFMKSAMKVEDQADYTTVTSTGNATLVPVASKPDERTAAITLATSVSRIQIKDVTFTGFTAGTLEGIFINNYYPTMELNGTAPTLVGSLVAAEYVLDSTPFPASLSGFVYDYSLAGAITATATPITPTNGVWGYNLFASATPQIVLKLSGVTTAGGSMPGDQFVTIHGFKDGTTNIATLAGGMIYTIGAGALVVKPEDLGPNPGMKPIKVSVTVTTVTWAETVVTPNL